MYVLTRVRVAEIQTMRFNGIHSNNEVHLSYVRFFVVFNIFRFTVSVCVWKKRHQNATDRSHKRNSTEKENIWIK